MAQDRLDDIATSKPLQLVHMDLVGPIQTFSIIGKMYILVIVDDYSRYTWVCLLREKFDTFQQFLTMYKVMLNESLTGHHSFVRIKTNHGNECENALFD